MFSWLAKQMISRNMRALRAGDPGPLLAMDADDVRFSFPGDSSFAPGASNKKELEAWLARFTEIGLQIHPDEVVLQGFPWRQRICVRGNVHLDDPAEGRVYDNRYVIWGRISWGRLREYEVYEDTQKSKAFDAWLERRGGPGAPGPIAR